MNFSKMQTKNLLIFCIFGIILINEILFSCALRQRHANNRFLLMEHVHPFNRPVQFNHKPHHHHHSVDTNNSDEDVKASFQEASKSYQDAINSLTKTKNRHKNKSSPPSSSPSLLSFPRKASSYSESSPAKRKIPPRPNPQSSSTHLLPIYKGSQSQRPDRRPQQQRPQLPSINQKKSTVTHSTHAFKIKPNKINPLRKPIRIVRPSVSSKGHSKNKPTNQTRSNLYQSKNQLKPSSSKDTPVTTADFQRDFNRTLNLKPKKTFVKHSSLPPDSKNKMKYENPIQNRPHQSKLDSQSTKDNQSLDSEENLDIESISSNSSSSSSSSKSISNQSATDSINHKSNQDHPKSDSVDVLANSGQKAQQQPTLSNLFSSGRLQECDCSARIQPKIIGGQDAYKGKYPFVAAIFTLVGRGSFCGASIVNERFLLTAAHCVARFAQQPHNYIAVVGRTDLNVSNPPEELMVRAERIWLNGWSNDVALVRLKQPIHFNRLVRPACFGGYSAFGGIGGITSSSNKFGFDQNQFDNAANVQNVMNQTTKVLIAIGWGYTGWKARPGTVPARQQQQQLSPTMTTRLQEVALNEVQCSKEPHLICVAAEGRSPCFGDSGSPLLHSSLGRQFVVGLTSRSSSHLAKYCLGAPTIYERTSFYLPWMRTITQNRFCEVN